jgi:transcriptional regulator with XRE-family HTH domain
MARKSRKDLQLESRMAAKPAITVADIKSAVQTRISSIGKNLKARREYLEMHQQHIANRVRMSVATISRIENGDAENLQLDTLIALAMALDMDLIDLILAPDSKGSKGAKHIAHVKRAKTTVEKAAKDLQRISKNLD